jgi:L-alanine-DL-glutamate epimerase-like enolase superfamily enzyme
VTPITGIETRVYRYPLEPPFRAAWDPRPRTHQEATVVLVHTEDGVSGVASGGDGLPDRALLEQLLLGVDVRETAAVAAICETVDFHGGRPWAVEVAVWDALGKVLETPVSKLLGSRNERLRAYASTGEAVGAEERVERCLELAERGFGAVKLRLRGDRWREDVALVAAVRDAVGERLELMVDANQGWRMPGDRAPRWDVATASACARELEALGVYWLEEPLPAEDPAAYAALREATGIRIAAGELVRRVDEACALVTRGLVDVVQADVLFVGGFEGCRRIAAVAEEHGRTWSPHTWSNGVGLVANLHGALGCSNEPWLEVPYDPPAWAPERRDWLLPSPVATAADGTIRATEGSGLGVELDLDALERWRVG